MSYDAVSAYTVMVGDGVGPTTVSVHGCADEAWAALAAVLAPGSDRTAVEDAAEAWRREDPTHRFWQVAAHRLQVQVPAIASSSGGLRVA